MKEIVWVVDDLYLLTWSTTLAIHWECLIIYFVTWARHKKINGWIYPQINQYIYIKPKLLKLPQISTSAQYLKKNIKQKKKNVIKDTLSLSRCLPPDALPFPFTMLCHLFLAFLFYQHLFDQTHCKPPAKHRI